MACGGAVGAVLRYLVDRRVQGAAGGSFPWGTLTVNVLGSTVLGFLAATTLAGADAQSVRLGIGVGLCGSLTTFSTFGYETVRLFTEGARRWAVANVAATVAAGFGAAAAGIGLAQLV